MVPATDLECSLTSIAGDRQLHGTANKKVKRSTSSGALDINGNAIHGLCTFAAGFRPDPKIGSEAAFAGRMYRVWSVRHGVGGRIMRAFWQN